MSHSPAREGSAEGEMNSSLRTSFLLLDGQLVPVHLHPISQGHPQISLLLRRHAFPSLLDVGKCRVRNGMRLTRLLIFANTVGDSGSTEGTGAHEGGGA